MTHELWDCGISFSRTPGPCEEDTCAQELVAGHGGAQSGWRRRLASRGGRLSLSCQQHCRGTALCCAGSRATTCPSLRPSQPFIVSELLMCSLHDYIYHPQVRPPPHATSSGSHPPYLTRPVLHRWLIGGIRDFHVDPSKPRASESI